MNKRILILTGSPRRGGNSDLMADAFAKGASEAGNIVMRFDTAHKHIQGCRASDNCFSKENKACIFNDDFNELASLMAESDVIVFLRSFELIAQDRGWKNRGHYLVNSVNEKGAILNTEHLQKIYNLGKDYDSPIEFS